MPNLNLTSSPVNASCLLDHFPLPQRSGVANQFFNAVRAGADTSKSVILAVKADALRRTLTGEGERLATQCLLLSLLKSAEADIYAQEVLDRESLPLEEKRRIKVERGEQYRREYLKAQKPTERQIRFLRSLGCQTSPANRWEASEMIGGHLKR